MSVFFHLFLISSNPTFICAKVSGLVYLKVTEKPFPKSFLTPKRSVLQKNPLPPMNSLLQKNISVLLVLLLVLNYNIQRILNEDVVG